MAGIAPCGLIVHRHTRKCSGKVLKHDEGFDWDIPTFGLGDKDSRYFGVRLTNTWHAAMEVSQTPSRGPS